MEINFTEANNNSDKTNFSGNFSGRDRYSVVHKLNYSIALCVINVILCFATVLENIGFLITIRKTSLHSVAKILLTSLAVSDLAVGLVGVPLFIAIMLSGGITIVIFGNVLGPFLGMASFLTVTAIGVDRLLALQLHLMYEAVVTSSRVTFVVIFIWVFSGMCTSMLLLNSKEPGLIAISAVSISFLAGNFVVYLKIYSIVRRHQRQIQQQQQQQANNENIFSVKRFKKSAINTFFVFILLLCCYTPYSVCISLRLSGACSSTNVYNTTVTFVYLDSSLNPLLYCWRDKEIRAAMKQLFRC
ncbi:histamine H2 receptor-like [Oculina patagonica]